MITRDYIRNNKDTMFIFGDNLLRKGLGGAAKVARGEENSYGIITKKYPNNEPSSFFTDADLKDLVGIWTAQFYMLNKHKSMYKKYYIFPLGVGLARLDEMAPISFAELQKFVEEFEKNFHE